MHQTLRQDASKFIDIRFCGAKRTQLPVRSFLQQAQPYTARTRIETRRSLVRQVGRSEILPAKGSDSSISYVANSLPTEVLPRGPVDASLVSFIRLTGETTIMALRQLTNIGLARLPEPKQCQGCQEGGNEEPVRTRASEPVGMYRRADTCRSGRPAFGRNIRSDVWAGEVVRPRWREWTRRKQIFERCAPPTSYSKRLAMKETRKCEPKDVARVRLHPG